MVRLSDINPISQIKITTLTQTTEVKILSIVHTSFGKYRNFSLSIILKSNKELKIKYSLLLNLHFLLPTYYCISQESTIFSTVG